MSSPPLMHHMQACDSASGVSKVKRELLTQETDAMLKKKAIKKAPPSLGFYARVFLVPKKKGKQCPDFNMKSLNAFIVSHGFRMATLKMVAGTLRKGDFVVSLDLSDAYFHLRIHPRFRRFLCFKFRGKLFQFRAMPFGLSSAPRVFTRITQPITLFCRRLGIRIIFYLDDPIIMARSRQEAIRHRDFVLLLLKRLGFLINMQKSNLALSRSFVFLGLHWNTEVGSISLTDDKVSKLHKRARRLSSLLRPLLWDVQKFLGLTNFAAFAVL